MKAYWLCPFPGGWAATEQAPSIASQSLTAFSPSFLQPVVTNLHLVIGYYLIKVFCNKARKENFASTKDSLLTLMNY